MIYNCELKMNYKFHMVCFLLDTYPDLHGSVIPITILLFFGRIEEKKELKKDDKNVILV